MIFIDSGAFIARFSGRDQHHDAAMTSWKRLAARGEPCLTSNFVLDEALTLIGRFAGNVFAADRARALYASRALRILRPDESVETAALDYFVKYADQGVSFTDCTSFVLMKRNRVKRVFTFDRHFARAGFTAVP